MNNHNKYKVWIVDDDSSIRWVLARSLRSNGYNVSDFEHGEAALRALERQVPDVVMTDIRMLGISGLELAKQMHQRHSKIPVIIMTAFTDLDSAVASYDSGAFEYLPKPFDLDDAVRLVKRALESKSEGDTDKTNTADQTDFKKIQNSDIIGESPAMQEVFRAIGRLAKSNINVLICGQSGTGKELIATALHQHSPRADKPLVVTNIAAIPDELLESELFGYEKNTFSSEDELHQGRFEQASGGTIFLDEVSEMNAALQMRLLRVLSDQCLYRVGGRELVKVDVRVIATTDHRLEKMVAQGQFREDLYHRLNVIRIDLPSLNKRIDDVPLLAEQFLRLSADELQVGIKQLSDQALEVMMNYDWPGNVRQLQNIARWITVMAPAKIVRVEDLPKEITSTAKTVQPMAWENSLATLVRQKLNVGQQDVLSDLSKRFEAILLRVALDQAGGHRQNAAKMLGWGRNTLTRKLKELDID